MILFIDNYDSFVYNVARYVQELGHTPHVVRNDQITVNAIRELKPQHIIISPGPCTPLEAGISNAVIQEFGRTTPILGVCLGHQCIGHVFGATVTRAQRPMHGKTNDITHNGRGLFQELPHPLTVTRYHSLIVKDLPETLVATAFSPDGEIMGLAHRDYPLAGIQFHPEAVLTQGGHQLFKNFLDGHYR